MVKTRVRPEDITYITVRVTREMKERLVERLRQKGYFSISEWLRRKIEEEIEG
ncbi:MAG: hypothetical protein QXQ60_08900 [Thermofilum sp.]